MRLSAIKLAGFKSFVDPTHLRLHSVLAGVVGPNGCGKSNVIDAVRWVMGESSARQLRGEALQDVIFNGAKSRKPVGRASVELTFDNSDASLGGRYADFGEIGIRREITRDGGSQYFLNGARCRRRDVVDIFLGTGLGARSSYAIIEQGTVTRIIEARAQDMRLLLEEAAGISKYKEKRRETENRIRHTRENLERLNDLRSELATQLEKLERQAKSAEKYKRYKAKERKLKAQLLVLRYRALERETAQRQRRVQTAEQHQAQSDDNLREATEAASGARAAQQQAVQRVQSAQADFYAAEASLAQVEQTLRHAREMAQMREQEKKSLQAQLEEAQSRQVHESDRYRQMERDLETLQERLRECRSASDRARTRAEAAQSQVDAEQANWDSLTREANDPVRALEAERARVNELTGRLQAADDRQQRLACELKAIDTDAMQAELARLDNAIAAKADRFDALKAESEAGAAALSDRRDKRDALEKQVHEARTGLQDCRGRLASLESLQAASLGRDDATRAEWLSERRWDNPERLGERITVTPGWETAVESVLQRWLAAVCLPDPIGAACQIRRWPSPGITLLARAPAEHRARRLDLTPLMSVIEGPLPQAMAGFVFLADDDQGALGAAEQLAPGEIAVSRSGLTVGPDWVSSPAANDEDTGVLERQRSIDALRGELEKKSRDADALSERIEALKAETATLDATLTRARREEGQWAESLNRDRSTREAKAVRLEQGGTRAQQLQAEVAELGQQIRQDTAKLEDSKEKFEASQTRVREVEARRQQVQAGVKQARQEAAAQWKALERARTDLQQMQVDAATRRSAMESAQRASTEYAERAVALETRVTEAVAAHDKALEPIAEAERSRETLTAERARMQQLLNETRAQQNAAGEAVERGARALRAAESEREAARDALQSLRLEGENSQARLQTLSEQIDETGFALQELSQQLDEVASADAWEGKIESMDRRIQRLGPINLAAIDEYQEQSRRAQYLDSQDQDLREALTTLEGAINRIDRETRARFRDTFERVDSGLRALFPKLFGGGEAYLEVTGDDLLEAGVRVMARPPGKRNSSIQLLSGGEKALTAVALVFSLFQLNPAPFCMLDEVDAPLDDANVGRFCNLVREMSASVQFVVITHNKLTMELADQLHGVTMQEPGVSRLVSVDVQNALEMAAS